MKKLILVLCCTFVFTVMCAYTAQAAPVSYTVAAGDSLWKISNQTGVSIETIKALNKLSSDSLQIGQVLRLQSQTSAPANAPVIPQQNAVRTAANSTIYKVQAGDTLWSIAVRNGLTVDMIKQQNQLQSDFLQIGQEIILGGSHSTSPNLSRASSEPRPGLEQSNSSIIDLARGYLGTPYRYGGASPGGFDCSGFTTYIFKQFNVQLPRTAAGQASVGRAVDRSDLMPGDLLLFKCYGNGIDHVGIYYGEGKFIHSSSPRSGGVILSSLNESYYLRSYVGARRIIEQ